MAKTGLRHTAIYGRMSVSMSRMRMMESADTLSSAYPKPRGMYKISNLIFRRHSAPSSDSTAPPYRRDIDGLRALAVLAVVGYHAFPELVPGGFVGVDVFFVISGYLITAIIQSGLDCDAFSLTGFYRRRVRRIFPALLLVLAFCLLAGHQLLLPDEFKRLGAQVLAGAGFASNLLLWSESGYFDTASELKPLLHLWSLGIEEQFYILWPLLLLLAQRTGGWGRATAGAIAAASMALCLWLSHTNLTAAFYSPFSRAWELALGSLLAFPATQRWLADLPTARARVRQMAIPNWIVLGGVLSIGLAITCLNRDLDYPGAATLLPTLGTAVLLAAGPRNWFHARVLSQPILVGIGLISYPLYLWHWPLLVFQRIVQPGPVAPSQRLAVVAAAFALAWATYRLVENPLRRGLRFKARPLATALALTALLGLACTCGAIQSRSASFGIDKIVEGNDEPEFPAPFMQRFPSRGGAFYQDGRGVRKLLYIGDSTMQENYLRIHALVEAHPDRSAVLATATGCPPIPGVKAEGRRPWCDIFAREAFTVAQDPEVDAVVIGADWYRYFAQMLPESKYVFDDGVEILPLAPDSEGGQKALASLGSSIQRLTRSGKRVFLILDTPFGEEMNPAHIVRRSLWRGFEIQAGGLNQRHFVRMTAPVTNALRKVAEANGAAVIDPVATLCDGRICPALTSDGRPRYHDSIHLRANFVRDQITYLDLPFEPLETQSTQFSGSN
ncbi:putative O-antigen acetylase [Burkholderia pseudomallei]|nr:putative O-antigen acetylase [Burkholderia pseudomallei]CAJ7290781.1 putative O-antigen acetylase [Burkholderia pseudomallei]CAJ8986302.1 putative O-antigen acetylase [Burkholderia pseudomallei]